MHVVCGVWFVVVKKIISDFYSISDKLVFDGPIHSITGKRLSSFPSATHNLQHAVIVFCSIKVLPEYFRIKNTFSHPGNGPGHCYRKFSAIFISIFLPGIWTVIWLSHSPKRCATAAAAPLLLPDARV
jgi:hypothetical protein